MKVLFAFYNAGRSANGGIRSMLLIADAAVEAGAIEATFISNSALGTHDVDVLPFGTPKQTHPRTYLRIAQRVATQAPDVIHANDIEAFLAFLPAAWAFGIPMVLNIRGYNPEHVPYGRRWRLARQYAHSILVLSEDMRRGIDRRLRPLFGPGAPVINGGSILPLGPQRSRTEARRKLREELGLAADARILLMAAAVCPRKAQLEHLRAWQHRLPADTHLVFAGDHAPKDAAYAQEFRDLAAAPHLQRNVHLLGYRNDIDALYRGADLSLVASQKEGLARCMLESLAQGTPVVSYDVASAHEFLSEPDLGRVLPQGQAIALLDAALTLLDAPEHRNEMGRRARHFVEARCAKPVVTQRYLDAYADAAEHR